jgi:DNA invertase Pin-like site-specific DNA recombinase
MKIVAEHVRAGLERAKKNGTRTGRPIGRPRVHIDRDRIVGLRNQGTSWRQIARRLGAGVGTVRRIYQATAADSTGACQNPIAEIL